MLLQGTHEEWTLSDRVHSLPSKGNKSFPRKGFHFMPQVAEQSITKLSRCTGQIHSYKPISSWVLGLFENLGGDMWLNFVKLLAILMMGLEF